MPNYFEISPAHDVLTLRDGKGSASVGVRYVGSRRAEARAIAVAMNGAKDAWLKVDTPDQRMMEPGQTQTFNVVVNVPPGTTAGRYGFRLDVVSVSNPDEEYDRGPLVSFEVKPAKGPEPDEGFPWWIIIAAGIVIILIIGGIIWWANSDSGPRRVAEEAGQVEVEIEEEIVRPVNPGIVAGRDTIETLRQAVPDRRGNFQVQQTFSIDFDSAQQISSRSRQADLFFAARSRTDRAVVARGGATLALLGQQDTPALSEIKSALRIKLVDEVDVDDLRPGFWFAVHTSEGNFVAATVERAVGADDRSIHLDYRLWESHSNE